MVASSAHGLSLDTPIEELPLVTAGRRTGLLRLGIVTARDVLLHLPRRYDDTREVVPLSALTPGPARTTRATVVNIHSRRAHHRRMTLVEATLESDGARVDAIWFNQQFLAHQLRPGSEVLLSGAVTWSRSGLQLRNPKVEVVRAGQRHVGTLAPIYPETDKLTSRFFRSLVVAVLPLADNIIDVLPANLRAELGLMSIAEALRDVHNPATPEAAAAARERIAFEELFVLQLAAQRARRRRLSAHGVRINYDPDLARRFAQSLPFTLTDGQRQAGHHILTDMAGEGPMNRLLQGDVGSGKTAVAALAAVMAHGSGFQTLVMAPTEILARQHHATLDALLTPLGVPPRLLVGSTSARARREVLDAVAGGHCDLLVGTHALIEDSVVLNNLGLVIVDEQHRFGVAQRQKLRLKGRLMPNFLAMTATPIPRSLALTVYGDVNLSELREMPPGRTPVTTRVVAPGDRDAAYAFTRAQVAAGRQVFVICPLVEESDKLGVKSATAEHARLSADVFPDLRVELLHGRLTAQEKEQRMRRFANGEVDVLVATSVVEVGVDVPNASVMLIEDAERFGIAQLHQLRGRVGRGTHESHCLLFDGDTDAGASPRLQAVAGTQSGFELAELDLRLRGPGDVAGLRQHGLPEMRAADLRDAAMVRRARDAAEQWLDRDPGLDSHPPLTAALSAYGSVFDLD